MSSLQLKGRPLWLTTSRALVERQLRGETLSSEEAADLRDDVSTDEITPVAILSYYDDRLSRYAYTGYQVEGQYPLVAGAVRDGQFAVTIAGKRYGKGSSREHSPAAEKWAGIQLVIAESFERIYRQNADNIGLFTSTDMRLAAQCHADGVIPLNQLLEGRDALSSAVLRCGGLLPFGQRYMREVRVVPPQETTQPQTLFEKIIARHWLQTELTASAPKVGEGGFVRADWRFIHEYYTGMCAHMLHSTFGPTLMLHDTASVVVFEDHSSYVEQSPAHVRGGLVANMLAMCQAQRDFVAENGLTCHRTLTEQEALQDDGRHVAGISHAMMAEHYALPGQLVAGTDSHTPHSGALGCVAFGVGTTDMANALVTGAVRITVPPVLRVWIHGALQAGVMAKDVVLHLLARSDIRAGAKLGQVFEFAGPTVRAMSIDERATLTNMVAELGGFTGIVEPDQRTVEFLQKRRGLDVVIEPWMCSDPGATYADVIDLDVGELSPMVARPGDPGRGVPLSSMDEPVRVDIAYGGSCTAGKREDFDHYHEVLAWALEKGWRKPDHVRLYLQFGTTAVRDYCQARGYLTVFQRAGAVLLQPSCGACANCGPGSSTEASEVTVSAINRNFPGRSGPGQVWLASPPTVVASAMAGRLVSFETLKSLSPPA